MPDYSIPQTVIPKMAAPKKQRGLVLILALLIVVLVTSLVVSTSWRFELSMSRNENRWHGVQGRLVMEGGEALVGKLLLTEDLRDRNPDGEADHSGEAWNEQLIVPVDGGQIVAQIEDAQGRFNINTLAIPHTEENLKRDKCKQNPDEFDCRYTVAQRRFIRLLQLIQLNETLMGPEEAIALTDAVIDWLDSDSQTSGFGGAEQDYYGSLEVPIVVSNAPMTSISELSLVKGFREQPELYEKLLPYVIALPAGNTGGAKPKPAAFLNINTMNPLMLQIFNESNTPVPRLIDEVQGLRDLRTEKIPELNVLDGRQGYQDAQEFVQDVVGSLNLPDPENDFDGSQLTFKTNYFIYSANVEIGDKTRRSRALIYRSGDANQKPETLWRTDANF